LIQLLLEQVAEGLCISRAFNTFQVGGADGLLLKGVRTPQRKLAVGNVHDESFPFVDRGKRVNAWNMPEKLAQFNG
jgi:hypothetical protein